MLCKTFKYIGTHSIGSGKAASQSTFIATSDISGVGDINLYLQNASTSVTIGLTINHNGDITDYGSKKMATNTAFSNIKIYKGDIVTFATDGSTYGGNNYNINLINFYEFPTSKLYKIYDLKNIGEKVAAILFGMLPDGTRRDGN